MCGFIKIDRKILEWEWYKDEHTKNFFFHCILKANWKECKFKGIIIDRGQFVSSLPILSDELSLTVNEIRTAIKHLKSTGEITVKSYPKFSIFTVVNYDLYQCESQTESQANHRQITVKPQADNRQITGKSQPINSLLTTIEEDKEYKEDKKERKEEGKNNKYYCPESEKLTTGQQPVIEIILNDKTLYSINQKDIDEWDELYPAVDVMQELRKMKDWSNSNPQKRKTRRGIRRFISNWLSKAQDNSSSSAGRNTYIDAIHNRVSEVDNWV